MKINLSKVASQIANILNGDDYRSTLLYEAGKRKHALIRATFDDAINEMISRNELSDISIYPQSVSEFSVKTRGDSLAPLQDGEFDRIKWFIVKTDFNKNTQPDERKEAEHKLNDYLRFVGLKCSFVLSYENNTISFYKVDISNNTRNVKAIRDALHNLGDLLSPIGVIISMDTGSPAVTIPLVSYGCDDDGKIRQREPTLTQESTIQPVNSFTLIKTLADNPVPLEELERNSIIKPANNTPSPTGAKVWTLDCNNAPFYVDTKGQRKYACSHPITIESQSRDVETGERKVTLKFQTTGKPQRATVSIETIANVQKIINLVELGISVTSINAKHLVDYLQFLLDTQEIPLGKTTYRFGWIGDNEFSPYSNDVIFDGGLKFYGLSESVKPCGNIAKWNAVINPIRHGRSTPAKAVLMTSYASALISPLMLQSFFTHIWGQTECGKTVAIMVSASVWANPDLGKYITSFNSTKVAQETLAGIYHSIPVIMDELQIRISQGSFDAKIYELTEGSGKSRGTIDGGLRHTYSWKNAFITSGEQPITKELSGAGAINRVLEFECKASQFENPMDLVDAIRENYGLSGKEFIETLTPDVLAKAKERHRELRNRFIKDGYPEKQSSSSALLLVADEITAEYLFYDKPCLTYGELSGYMVKSSELSKEARAWEWLKQWIVQNRYEHFSNFKEGGRDIYGTFCKVKKTDSIAIFSTVLDKACKEQSIDVRAFASYMRTKGYLMLDSEGKNTRAVKVYGSVVRCYVIDVKHLDIDPTNI